MEKLFSLLCQRLACRKWRLPKGRLQNPPCAQRIIDDLATTTELLEIVQLTRFVS
jgi:hypothetical protein